MVKGYHEHNISMEGIHANFEKITKLRHELDSLEEARKKLAKSLDAHHTVEAAEGLDKLDSLIEQKKAEEAELLNAQI